MPFVTHSERVKVITRVPSTQHEQYHSEHKDDKSNDAANASDTASDNDPDEAQPSMRYGSPMAHLMVAVGSDEEGRAEV